jgi:hypothetical protein
VNAERKTSLLRPANSASGHGAPPHPASRHGIVSGLLVALALSFVCTLFSASARAGSEELPSSRQEINRALGELRRRYGDDAVRMQAHLLRSAVGGGSVLEASAGVAGIEQHEGKRYLRFDVVTGIVYDDASVPAAERPVRLWTDVVDPALRPFTAIDLPADGVVLVFVYQHVAYRDRAELLQKLREAPAPSDEIRLHLSAREIVEFAHARLSASELLDHAAVELNGRPARIELPRSAAIPAPPPTPAFPLFPPDQP